VSRRGSDQTDQSLTAVIRRGRRRIKSISTSSYRLRPRHPGCSTRSIVPQCRFRRAQNVKTPLLTGRTIPSLPSWFTARRLGNSKVTLCRPPANLIPGNKYKPPVRRDRGPQWVAVMPRQRNAEHGARRRAARPRPARAEPCLPVGRLGWLRRESVRPLTGNSILIGDPADLPPHPRPLTSRKEHRNARRPVDLSDTRNPDPADERSNPMRGDQWT
jgi:hypothetical protein